jgi:hypothetical protein
MAMDFEALEIGDLQGFLDDVADMLDVGKSGGAIGVSFAAESQVAVKAKAIVEASGFTGGPRDKLLADLLELADFAGVNPEVGHYADARVDLAHREFSASGLGRRDELGHHLTEAVK